MATTVTPAPPTEAKAPPPSTGGGGQAAAALGLPSATALVIGSIIGTGVFTMPAVMAGAGTSSILTLGGHRRRRRAARRAVRSADQAGPDHRRRPVRLRPPRVRRLRRLPDRVVLLDHLLGRQRRHRGVVGLLRRVALRHRQPVDLGQLRHRPHRAVDPRRHQPGRRPPDGLVPERHRRPEVPAAAAGRHARLVLRRPVGQLRPVQRLGRQPVRRHQPGRRRGPVLLHRRRVRLDRRRPGQEPPAQRRPGVDRSAPPPAACSTSP